MVMDNNIDNIEAIKAVLVAVDDDSTKAVGKTPITEESGEHKQWYVDAHAPEMTLETLPEFLRHLTEDYHHDYGTICHALAAGAIATAYAMDRSPQGGITGFQ